MASRNAESMTNAQGEFHPSKPRDEPLTTKGHQVGQQVGNDAAPEFSAEVLPAGTAPKESTFHPNPVNETPGQALNPDAQETTSALDTLGGATSGDVHTGLGHPGSGESSAETRHEGKSHRAAESAGQEGSGVKGGLGMAGEEESAEAKALKSDHTPGPKAAQEHNASVQGATDRI